MRDAYAPALPSDQGERLVREVYKRDFRERDAAVQDGYSWKLERRQHFEEQGSESRDALRRGHWSESLRLLEERRDALRTAALEDERRGHVFHRVRVVQKPLTPYLQWQFHSLRIRAEYGERIRVVAAAAVAASESSALLPEIVILGGRTLYRVMYDEAGAPNGAFRYTGPEIVARWEEYLRKLYAAGEDVGSYFDREVAPLPPPVKARSESAANAASAAETE